MAAKDTKTIERNGDEQKDLVQTPQETPNQDTGIQEITVSFDDAKLKALDFYLKDHGITAQEELQNYLATMFMRAVPQEVRRFNFPEAEQELQDKTALFAGPAKSNGAIRNGRDREETPEERARREEMNAKNRERRRLKQAEEQDGQYGANPLQPGQQAPANGIVEGATEQGKPLGLAQTQ